MGEFIQNYGLWILLGGLFLWMIRGRGRGMGCAMGHQHNEEGKPRVRAEENIEQDSINRGSGCH